MKTIDEQITCVRRELALRKRVYPKWVAKATMRQHQADHEIECMAEVEQTLMKLKVEGLAQQEQRTQQQPELPHHG